MKTNNIYIAGLVITLIGGVISWQAFLKETDPKKRSKRIAIGTAISMFGVGMFVTAIIVENKLVKA